MLSTALLASGILLTFAIPPAFEQSPSGGARDGQTVVQAPSPRRQVIAIVPDRTTGRDWGLRYLREAVHDLNRESPDAVFCVGDLVQGYSRDHSAVTKEREDFLAIMRALRMPFYPTAGNHDLVSGKRDANDRSFADEFHALFGPLYYAVELEFASFVILNTEDGDGRIEPGFSDEQLSWLDATLARLEQRNRPIILLFHRPLWDHKPTRWDERVQPMLVKHGVDYVIAGHYHALQALPARDGIPFLVLGTCGGAIDQHPLAGQLQHVTFVIIDETGKIEPYHQIAGCTLPVDWITKADQDLAYKLKTTRNCVTLRGAVADALGQPTSGSVEVEVRNPLDRAVDFAFRATAPAAPWEVVDREDGKPITRVWTRRTAIDSFNPWTTDIDTPFALDFDPPKFVLAAGESRVVKVSARCGAQALPPEPPPFEIVATYSDSKERRVPVLLRGRIPLLRAPQLASDLDAATPYSIAVWTNSEFDPPERNASARFLVGAGDSAMRIALTVPDLQFSPDAKARDSKVGDSKVGDSGVGDSGVGNSKPSLDDPLGDGVRVVLGEGPDSREFLVTFTQGTLAPVIRSLSPDRSKLQPSTDLAITLTSSQQSWNLAIDVLRSAIPAGTDLNGLSINVGVADNDSTYHTQWRWLAPRETPARISTGP